MMFLLTDEEIEEIIGEELHLCFSGHVAEYHDIAKAQLKKVAEKLTEEMAHYMGLEPGEITLDHLPYWQALLEEANPTLPTDSHQ